MYSVIACVIWLGVIVEVCGFSVTEVPFTPVVIIGTGLVVVGGIVEVVGAGGT